MDSYRWIIFNSVTVITIIVIVTVTVISLLMDSYRWIIFNSVTVITVIVIIIVTVINVLMDSYRWIIFNSLRHYITGGTSRERATLLIIFFSLIHIIPDKNHRIFYKLEIDTVKEKVQNHQPHS